MTIKIAPSILTADFNHLGREIAAAQAAGVDWLHLEVMDGHFVPNLSFGPLVARAARAATTLPLDVHLMVEQPERLLDAFIAAGADRISVHLEACVHLHRVVQQIKEAGACAGVALNPATPLHLLEEILPELDQVLVMSVNPGFGGQAYIPASTARVQRLAAMVAGRGLTGVEIIVDGGVKAHNAAAIAAAGATVLVAGSAVFDGRHSVADNVAALRAALP